MLAVQLPVFAGLFSTAATYEVVVPFALSLLSDPVAVVREDTVPGVPALINRLGADDTAMQLELVERLLLFGVSTSYHDRIVFVHICGAAARHCDVNTFRRNFLVPLVGIAQDPVRNVRTALAQLLNVYVKPLTLVQERTAAAEAAKRSQAQASGAGAEGGSSGSNAAPEGASAEPAPVAPPADVYAGIDEDDFPMWAREDTEGLLVGALVRLANDVDGEVLTVLDPAWIRAHRTTPMPDVKEYILRHAQAPPQTHAATASGAGAGEGGGVDGVDGASTSVSPSMANAPADAHLRAAHEGGSAAPELDASAAHIIAQHHASLVAASQQQQHHHGGHGAPGTDGAAVAVAAALRDGAWSGAMEAEAEAETVADVGPSADLPAETFAALVHGAPHSRVAHAEPALAPGAGSGSSSSSSSSSSTESAEAVWDLAAGETAHVPASFAVSAPPAPAATASGVGTASGSDEEGGSVEGERERRGEGEGVAGASVDHAQGTGASPAPPTLPS